MVSRQLIVNAAHEAWYPGFGRLLREMKRRDEADIDQLYAIQSVRLTSIVRFAFRQVRYYRDYALNTGLEVGSVRSHDALSELPIVTREEVQRRRSDFLPHGWRNPIVHHACTSGTTGTPLSYRLSMRDRAVGLALMYRGWGYSGYRLGDRVLLLAGRSLGSSYCVRDLHLADHARNLVRLSAFDMTEKALGLYVAVLNQKRPAYIRGYPSALRVLARWVLHKGGLTWQPHAVLTTAEVLLPEVRSEISRALGCPVFDGYGLNDGGVSAFECEFHCGLHVDTERSILEVVDNEGNPLAEGTGRIIATTLTNYAMPLLRYDTGDIGELVRHQCSCGRQRPLLKAIHGRSTDVLVTPEGKLLHGWFFVYLLRDMSRYVAEFEVVQETVTDVSIVLVPTSEYNSDVEGWLREVIREFSPAWIVRIHTVEALQRVDGEKRKYVRTEVDVLNEVR